MPQQQTIADILVRGSGMLRKHLADFTDADMLARPVPNANHAAWQIAHLLKSSLAFAKAVVPSIDVRLPPPTETVTKDKATSDVPADFPSKDAMLDTQEAIVAKLADGVRTMTDADLERPAPEALQWVGPTVAQIALMLPLHQTMHIGQIQVIRRKLGKPVLF